MHTATTEQAEPAQTNRFNAGMRSSKSAEWYTPQHIIDRVIALFGHIDLDPCSNGRGDAANVPARVHYTSNDDGLAQSWRIEPSIDDAGETVQAVRAYINPPYGDEIEAWVRRVVDAYQSGEITEAVALLPARVDTNWWRQLRAYPWCALHGRLYFSNAEHAAPFPSAIVYLGPDLPGFIDAFGDIGIVYTPAK